MTLQQLKYIIAMADTGSLSKASELVYVSQPSLSSSLKELETEIGVELFVRSSRGLKLTSDGQIFLSYARQVIEQFSLIEENYIEKKVKKQHFGVSTQHYSFAVKAFINMVNTFGMEEYEFAIRETKTFEVIQDVVKFHSEIGILYLNNFNKTILTKIFDDNSLEWNKLFSCNIYVYLWNNHPLSNKEKISIKELDEFPCLVFEQGNQNSFYFSEEVLSTYKFNRLIRATDRATMLNLMKGLNGYTLCSGVISNELNGNEYKAVPLETCETMDIGYIKKNNSKLSELAQHYIEEILKI
ncbi:MAG: LysR family transcriptional regulator [Clostridia bacterium]